MPWSQTLRGALRRRKLAVLALFNALTLLALWAAAAGLIHHRGERFYLVVPWVYAAGIAWLALLGERKAALRRASVMVGLVLLLAALLFYDHHHPSAGLIAGERVVLAYACVAVVVVAGWMYLGVGLVVDASTRTSPSSSSHRKFIARIVTLLLFSIVLTGYTMALLQSHFPKLRSDLTPRMLHRAFDTVQFPTQDGLVLTGWFVPVNGAERTALVCHGVGAYKADMLDFIEALAGGGYNVLAFDFRGHGESEGHSISFGAKEKQDVRAAVDWLLTARPQQARRIVGVGWSMGAVSLILAAAEDERIEALHLDAPYARTRDIARVIARPFPPVYRQVGYYLGLAIASVDAGANLFRLAPVDAVAKIAPRPILIVHGTSDALIPIEQGRMVYAAAGEPKRFVEIPGAGHCGTIGVDSPEYERRMVEFLNEALARPRADSAED